MEPSVAVIGTTFIDCKGFAVQGYNPYGRNLGHIKFVHGGVGRNVAENLALLNVPTFIVSTIDNSGLGEEVEKRLLKSGVNLDFFTRADGQGMGMWMAILNQHGELMGSISRMPNLDILEEIISVKGDRIIESVTHVALELDLNEKISRQVIEIARRHNRRVYGIPGNLEVVLSHLDLLSYTDCFICNDIEAGQLVGKDLAGMDINDLQAILEQFVIAAELPSMVITLAERGSVYYDAITRERGYQPAFPTDVVDSSGAGDAFFSGTVMGLVRNRSLAEAVVYGTRVASWTLQKEENNCLDLPERVKRSELFRD